MSRHLHCVSRRVRAVVAEHKRAIVHRPRLRRALTRDQDRTPGRMQHPVGHAANETAPARHGGPAT